MSMPITASIDRDCTLAPYGACREQVSLSAMTRSLKSNYLLLAIGVSAVLLLILGGFAYYEHRLNTSDASQLTYVTVEQKLEADLEARASSLSNTTSASLAAAMRAGDNAQIA